MNIEYMKGYMKNRGLRVGAIAKTLKVTPQTVYNTFYGKRHFSLEQALEIKTFMRMTNNEFEQAFQDESWYRAYRKGMR